MSDETKARYAEADPKLAVGTHHEGFTVTRVEALPELDRVLLVYCRSGRRSKEAAQKLADMGYTNVYEFGGINEWTGDVE